MRVLEMNGTRQPAAPLTSRELEVLRTVAAGLTNRQAARRLNVAERTIRNHLTAIYRKLDVTNRTAAVCFAVRHDWISA
jgi:DNA-binding NarL/FixJ family response regulator